MTVKVTYDFIDNITLKISKYPSRNPYRKVLEQPGLHDVCSGFGEDPPLFLAFLSLVVISRFTSPII